MRSGLLTEQISVYRPTITTNEFGEQIINQEFLYNTRARLVVHRYNRTNVDNAIAMPGAITIQVRHYHDIRQNDIVTYKGTKYHVLSVQPLQQEMCYEVDMTTMESDNTNE